MSQHSHQQTPLERARAEMSTLNRTFETDLDKFRTASKEYDTHIHSLTTSFQEKQQNIITNVENALKLSETRNRDLEHSLLTHKKEAESKHNKVVVELASQKLNNGFVKFDLKKAKSELDEARRQVECLQQDVNAAKQRISDLEKDCAAAENRHKERLKELDAVKERNDHLEAEFELVKREPEDLRKRLEASEQQISELKADLGATTQRASTAEDELKALKSLFKKIKDDMVAFPSSGRELIEAQPEGSQTESSAFASVGQEIAEGRDSGSQTNEALTRPQSHESHGSDTMANEGSDLLHCQSVLNEVMESKNWESNRFFLKSMDALTLASRDAKVGPMNLDIIKETLANEAYTSSTSFKADFDQIVADCRKLNPPMNSVRVAAEHLSKIFEQAWQEMPKSSHQSSGTAMSVQVTGNRKRKAELESLASSEDGYIQKRRSVAPSEQDADHVQPAIPGTESSPMPVLPSPAQPEDNFPNGGQANTDEVKRQIKTGGRLEIDAAFSTVAQLVSFTKSPNTITGHWKSLIPDEYRITGHARPSTVAQRIFGGFVFPSSDIIILRLLPAAEADKLDFNRVLEYLIQRDRSAYVRHTGIANVKDIYLTPMPKTSSYSDLLSSLDVDLLPPAETEDVLLMAIIFGVAENKQKQVRDAWNGRLKAIQKHDEGGLVSMHNILMRNPLHIFRKQKLMVSSAERHSHMLHFHIDSFGSFDSSKNVATPELQAHGQYVFRVSYPTWPQSSRPRVDGVVVPNRVFVLGRLAYLGFNIGLLVVDIQDKDRPLWLIRYYYDEDLTQPSTVRTITLLGSKFPGSLREWEKTLPANIPSQPRNRSLEKITLTLEPCKMAY